MIYFARFFNALAATAMTIIADIAAITMNATSTVNAVDCCGAGDCVGAGVAVGGIVGVTSDVGLGVFVGEGFAVGVGVGGELTERLTVFDCEVILSESWIMQ